MSILLTLDIATNTGWAVGPVSAVDLCEFGTLKLKNTGANLGPFFDQYIVELTDMVRSYKPESVVFEAPILTGMTNITTLRKLYTLAGLTEVVCHREGVDVSEANLTKIRKHFLGFTRAPKEVAPKDRRPWLKRKTIEQCQLLGWTPKNDNEADALALRCYSMKEMHNLVHPLLAKDLFEETA